LRAPKVWRNTRTISMCSKNIPPYRHRDCCNSLDHRFIVTSSGSPGPHGKAPSSTERFLTARSSSPDADRRDFHVINLGCRLPCFESARVCQKPVEYVRLLSPLPGCCGGGNTTPALHATSSKIAFGRFSEILMVLILLAALFAAGVSAPQSIPGHHLLRGWILAGARPDVGRGNIVLAGTDEQDATCCPLFLRHPHSVMVGVVSTVIASPDASPLAGYVGATSVRG
jgi:hypothetical protein